MKKVSESGFSIMELTLTTGLLVLSAAGIFKLLSVQNQSFDSMAKKNDLQIIRQTLFDYTDCDETIAQAGIMPATDCTSTSATQAGPYFNLWRRHRDGSTVSKIGGDLDANGWATLNGWKVRTSCSETEDSLVVYGVPEATTAARHKIPRLLFGGDAQFLNSYGENDGQLPLCSGNVASAGALISWTGDLARSTSTSMSEFEWATHYRLHPSLVGTQLFLFDAANVKLDNDPLPSTYQHSIVSIVESDFENGPPVLGNQYKICNDGLTICTPLKTAVLMICHLASVKIVGSNVEVVYSKNVWTNYHLMKNGTNYDGWGGIVVPAGINVVEIIPLSNFQPGFAVGSEVWLRHGNGRTPRSGPVIVTN